MMEKGQNQQFVEIHPITFHNDHSINPQFEITRKMLVALQPKYPLHYVVYQISESNLTTPFNLLICLKRNRSWGINVMNDGK